MIGLPNPWLILGAVVLVTAAGGVGYFKGQQAGENAVQVRWDQENAERAFKSAENVQRTRDTEQNLQAKANDERKRNATVLAGMDAQLQHALVELSKRPARPAGGPGDVQPAGARAEGGGTGAGLYADDALFLTRKADLWQRIRLQRDDCYAKYERADEALKRLGSLGISLPPQ